MRTLKGAIPPMITPFKENGGIDFEAHSHNIAYWNDCQLGGLLVLGSNSEAVFLSKKEKLELLKMTVSMADTSYPILIGSGMESTIETIRLTNEAAEHGAQAALIITPHFYQSAMTDRALINHFLTLANQCDIPILIYNVTKFTGVNVSTTVIEILSQHPNIIGMKDSSGNLSQLIQLQAATADQDFQVLTGTASIWLPALALGVEAAIMALANCAAKACVQLQQGFQAGKANVTDDYRRLIAVNQLVTAGMGIPALKYACDLMGLKGGQVRQPLQSLAEVGKQIVENTLRQAKLIA